MQEFSILVHLFLTLLQLTDANAENDEMQRQTSNIEKENSSGSSRNGGFKTADGRRTN